MCVGLGYVMYVTPGKAFPRIRFLITVHSQSGCHVYFEGYVAQQSKVYDINLFPTSTDVMKCYKDK